MPSKVMASYLPDSQVIYLSPEFPVFASADPAQHEGFQSLSGIAYFFHEWVHYLHNVSTIQGLSAFGNLVHLWSTFRHTMFDGVSRGASILDEKLALDFKQYVVYLAYQRLQRENEIPETATFDDVTFVSVTNNTRKIDGSDFDVTKIRCVVLVNMERAKKNCVVDVGTTEILESIAFSLESRMVSKGGGKVDAAPFYPYFLVRGIASHVAPEVPEDVVLACAILSLQESDPPSVLLEIIAAVRAEVLAGRDPLVHLIQMAIDAVNSKKVWVEEQLDNIDAIFPLDEPMARAIRSTTRTIRRNFAKRLANPFFEVGMVMQVLADPSNFADLVNEFGVCAVVQEQYGDPDLIGRDFMFDFKLEEKSDEWSSYGFRQMHAAFRFMELHIGGKGATPTEKVAPGPDLKCPFYFACSYPLRKNDPVTCATRPWLSAKTAPAEICWYGAGVGSLAQP